MWSIYTDLSPINSGSNNWLNPEWFFHQQDTMIWKYTAASVAHNKVAKVISYVTYRTEKISSSVKTDPVSDALRNLFFFPLYTPGPSFKDLGVEDAFYYAIIILICWNSHDVGAAALSVWMILLYFLITSASLTGFFVLLILKFFNHLRLSIFSQLSAIVMLGYFANTVSPSVHCRSTSCR